MEGKYLITTDSWFIAPDGNQYVAVWGDVEIVEDSVLGVKTNIGSTNWYARVGSKDNHYDLFNLIPNNLSIDINTIN